jgi:hypothetical protein
MYLSGPVRAALRISVGVQPVTRSIFSCSQTMLFLDARCKQLNGVIVYVAQYSMSFQIAHSFLKQQTFFYLHFLLPVKENSFSSTMFKGKAESRAFACYYFSPFKDSDS